MRADIVLVGAGGHAISVTNVALSSGYNVVSYVDDKKAGTEILGIPVTSTDKCYKLFPTGNFCIAIGDNSVRERVANQYQTNLPKAKFPCLIHKSSIVGLNSDISEGSIIMPQTNIGPNSCVGKFCIINTSSTIDHDCIMHDFSSIAPGVATGGNITLGVRSTVSIGATVKHGICIGHDVVVGANSYVNKNLDNNIVASGIPCKKIRDRELGDSYLS